MPDEVKTRRRYESARRRQQAQETRAAIVAAAGTAFRDHGYSVAMSVIAARAGVAVETIYRTFGTKRALLEAAVDALLAGGVARAATPVEERPAIQAIVNEPDPRRQIALYAATQPGIHRRAGPLLRALRDARTTDPELERIWNEMENARYAGQQRLAKMLGAKQALKPGQSVDAATDVVWTLCSLSVYDLLTLGRGWTDAAYEAWLSEALAAALLPPDSID